MTGSGGGMSSENGHHHMHTIGVIYRERSMEAAMLAQRLAHQLGDRGHEVWWAERHELVRIDNLLTKTNLALVLGGDGTILSVARLCAPLRIPILGINFGRVGFLTELEPDEVEEKIPLYLDGDYWIDERTMLHAEVEIDGAAHEFIALNDIALVRGAEPRVIHIEIALDGYAYNTTTADGVVVSTATGSTAYNLAAGGPILHPQVRSSVITPVAPHLAADRSLILEPNTAITLRLTDDSTAAVLSADGQINRDIPPGTQVTIRGNRHVTRFLRRRSPTYFYRILTAKLRDNL
ncbi:MAG: NAD(+)/NADH kinase [Ktedonobacterales bacterium]